MTTLFRFFFGVKTGIPRQDWPTWSSRRRWTSGESADRLPLVSTKGSLGHENVIIRPPSVFIYFFFFIIKSLLIVHSRLPSIHPCRVRTKAGLHIIERGKQPIQSRPSISAHCMPWHCGRDEREAPRQSRFTGLPLSRHFANTG